MKHVPKIGILVFAVTVVAGAIAVGCASTPLQTETATSGIRAASEVGAADVPQAALHLQLAREELARANRLSSEGEDERAVSMLARAEVDAELALALSREDAEKVQARAAMEQVRQLRQSR
ncbi:MAG: DUF4398 domain-containing protein [Deltaproteobacteria bacterium]|nr:DUF4398 domain-containing protein [Deltaproteobacteria bacterium]